MSELLDIAEACADAHITKKAWLEGLEDIVADMDGIEKTFKAHKAHIDDSHNSISEARKAIEEMQKRHQAGFEAIKNRHNENFGWAHTVTPEAHTIPKGPQIQVKIGPSPAARKALIGGGVAAGLGIGAGAAYGAYRHFNNKTAAYNLVNQANSGEDSLSKTAWLEGLDDISAGLDDLSKSISESQKHQAESTKMYSEARKQIEEMSKRHQAGFGALRDHVNNTFGQHDIPTTATPRPAAQKVVYRSPMSKGKKGLIYGGIASLGAGAAYGAYRHFNNKTAAYNLVNQANSGMVNLGAHSGAGFAERKEYVKNAPSYMRMTNQQAYSQARGTTPKGGAAPAAETTAKATASKAAPAASNIKPGGFLSNIKGKRKMLAGLAGLAGVGGIAMNRNKTAATQEEIDAYNKKQHAGHPSAQYAATLGAGGILAGGTLGRAAYRTSRAAGVFDELEGQMPLKAIRRAIVGGGMGALGLMGAGLGYTLGKHQRSMQQNSGQPDIKPLMSTGTGLGIAAGGLGSMAHLAYQNRAIGGLAGTGSNALKFVTARGATRGALVGAGLGYAADKLLRDNGRPKTAGIDDEDHTVARDAAKMGLIFGGLGGASSVLGRKALTAGLGKDFAAMIPKDHGKNILTGGIIGGLGGGLYGLHHKAMKENSGDPNISTSMGKGFKALGGAGALVGGGMSALGTHKLFGPFASKKDLAIAGLTGAIAAGHLGSTIGAAGGYLHDRLARNNGRPKTAADAEYTADDMAASRERAKKLGLVGAGLGAATAPLLNKWTGGSFGGVRNPMLSAILMGGGATYMGALTSMHKSKMQHLSGNKNTTPSADTGAIAGALAGAGSGLIAGANRFNSLHGRSMYPDRGRQAALIGASGLIGATLGGLAGGIAGYAHDVKVRGNGSNDAELYRKQREVDQALADRANGRGVVQKAKPAGDAAYSADDVNYFLSSYYGGKKTAADMTYDPTQMQYMEQTEQTPNSPKRSLGLIGAGATAGAAVNAGLASRHNGAVGAYSQLIGKAKELGIPNAINESKGIARSISRSARSGGMLGASAAVGTLAAPYLTKKLTNQS